MITIEVKRSVAWLRKQEFIIKFTPSETAMLKFAVTTNFKSTATIDHHLVLLDGKETTEFMQ
jgi:hypothetical protein